MRREALDHLVVVSGPAVPAADGTACERQRGVDDDAFRVEKLPHPEAVTGRACARGIVERKQTRLEFGQAVAADIAGEAVGEHQLLAAAVVHPGDAGDAVGQAQRGLEGLGEPQAHVVLDAEAVDDSLDRMLPPQVELRWLVEFVYLAVDARANEALRHQVLHQLHVLALAIVDDRCEQHQSRAFLHCEYLVYHLADRLCL